MLAILAGTFTLQAIDLDFNAVLASEIEIVLAARQLLSGGNLFATIDGTPFGSLLWPSVAAFAERLD